MSKVKFTPEQQQMLRENPYTIHVTADVLGKQRIWGISHCIRKRFEETGEFSDIRTPAVSKTGATPKEKIRQLEHQVSYLPQEVGAAIMHDSSCVFEIIHQTKLSSNAFSVKELCQIAGVSRSGYYAWLKVAPIREPQEQQDFDLILTAYKMHGFTKGAKGIYMACFIWIRQSS